VAPVEWQGGLNFTYYIGPGPAQVKISIESNFTITPIWNVIAKLPGSIEPDRWIILGSHRGESSPLA
jgi:N-acetylated-alpha-linked acidic dipeptidase